jgi:hypothetical protein
MMAPGGEVTDIKVPKGSAQLASADAALATTMDAIGSGDLVRDTTRIKNLLEGSDVTRSFGYDEVFEVFKDKKSGITKAQIQSFKDVPKVENFIKDGVLDSNKYNKAMKKFNKDVISKLDDKALKVLRSSGYLADYAQDSRISILQKGLKFGKDGKVLRDAKGDPIIKKGYGKAISISSKTGLPVITKAFESQYLADNFDFVFKSKDTAKGVKTKKFQSKVFTDIQNWGKKNLNKARQLTLDIALAQIDKLPGKQKTAALTALLSTIAKSGFAKMIPVVGPASTAYDVANLSKTFGPDIVEGIQQGLDTVTEPVTSKIAEAESMFENMLKSKMNKGGMMDINYMTRPLGYKDGTREGELVGDNEKRSTSGQLNQKETDMITESFPGLREFAASEVMKAAGDQKGVDTVQLASNYLRSLQMGLSGNEEAMNTVINILNTKIVPEEQLKLVKEGQSDLGSIAQKAGSGLESLYQKLPDMFQIFGKQEPGEGKIQTMDDRTLEALRDKLMRAQ